MGRSTVESWMSVLLDLIRPSRYEKLSLDGELQMREYASEPFKRTTTDLTPIWSFLFPDLSGVLIPLFVPLAPGQNVRPRRIVYSEVRGAQEFAGGSVAFRVPGRRVYYSSRCNELSVRFSGDARR